MAVNVADLVATMRLETSGLDKTLADMRVRLGRAEEDIKRLATGVQFLADEMDNAGRKFSRAGTELGTFARIVGVAMQGLTGTITGLVTVLGHQLYEAWKKSADEARDFQRALDSVDAGKINGEIDKLIGKLDELADKKRKASGPAGAPTNFPQTFLSEVPPLDLGSSFPTGADKEIDETLDKLARARAQQRGTAENSEFPPAAMAAFEKLKRQNILDEDKEQKKTIEDLNASWTAYAQTVFDATEKEQLALVKIQDELKKQEDELQGKSIASWVAHAEAVIAETEREQLAIVKQQDEALKEEERFRQEDIKGWVAHAEAVIDATEKEQLALVDLQDQRLRDQQKFVKGFDDINSAIANTAGLILQNTTSVEQAFAQMGRNIASSLIENVINRGLKVVEEALFNFLEDLQKSGALRQLISAAVGLVSGVATSTATTGAGAGGDVASTPYATAEGGVFSGAQWRMIGEAGPEAVIPLKGGAVPVMLNGGGTIVNIYNQAPETTVESQERSGDGGKRIYDIVIRNVRAAAQNGELDSVMATYGARRQGASR